MLEISYGVLYESERLGYNRDHSDLTLTELIYSIKEFKAHDVKIAQIYKVESDGTVTTLKYGDVIKLEITP